MKTILSWSSGKDSLWALYLMGQDPKIEVMGLVTTLNEVYQRVAMHAVRLDLLELQAQALGLPLAVLPLPDPCSNEIYQSIMGTYVEKIRGEGVQQMAFGDLFLEDVRAYREKALQGTGLAPLFPLWGRPTLQLSREMVRSGLKAVVTCVDPKVLPESFAGRAYDESFLSDLPSGIDPCGEKGEFHTFVYDGPPFKVPLSIQVGEIVSRQGFVFSDVKFADVF